MSPHADVDTMPVNGTTTLYDGPVYSHAYSTQGLSALRQSQNRSHLRHTPDDELHDLICIGFGPASLAIAVALHDSIEEGEEFPELSGGKSPKVTFLEQQPQFAWHSGMLLEGAKMQISFIKDMATLRNPRSEFTFLNYLHHNDRLVDFTNLNTFLPRRVEYEDYMRWCASWFDEVVRYSQRVLQIVPEKDASGKVSSYQVISSSSHPGAPIISRRTKNVVVATGGIPKIPDHLPQRHPRVIHSAYYAHVMPKLFSNRMHPYRFAVIGSGQSAAEIFHNMHEQYPNSKTRLIIKTATLKPSDDSPFVNEVFNPSRVDEVFACDPVLRAAAIKCDRNTNYGVVRLELIERIYEDLYIQRLRYPSENEWPHRLLTHRNVLRIEDSPAIPHGVRLHIRDESGAYRPGDFATNEILDVDAVFIATGYRRDYHEELLKEATWIRRKGDEKWKVTRDYRVQVNDALVNEDAGIWLQGCCEETHGLSDSLLSILSVRGGEIVDSVFGRGQPQPLKLNGFSGH